jgi:hypothetical protein
MIFNPPEISLLKVNNLLMERYDESEFANYDIRFYF